MPRRNLPSRFAGAKGVGCLAVLLVGFAAAVVAGEGDGSANLAANRPAKASSIENDEHDAAHANDGKIETSWRADDEPVGGPGWWQVDLGKALDLSACRITWPYDRINYRCKIEGSADEKNWQVLSDQTQTTSRKQVQRLTLDHAQGIRYVRITITGFDD